jgi:hypothetical protein
MIPRAEMAVSARLTGGFWIYTEDFFTVQIKKMFHVI